MAKVMLRLKLSVTNQRQSISLHKLTWQTKSSFVVPGLSFMHSRATFTFAFLLTKYLRVLSARVGAPVVPSVVPTVATFINRCWSATTTPSSRQIWFSSLCRLIWPISSILSTCSLMFMSFLMWLNWYIYHIIIMSSTQFILTIIFALLALFGTVQPVAADAGDVIGGLLGGG